MENEKIMDEFEELANEINENEGSIERTSAQKEVELTVDDFSTSKYLNTPEVGESITFTVDRIVENFNTTGKNKLTGEEFTIGCKRKDGSIVRYDIITTENERFVINSWGLFFLFKGADSLFANEVRKRGTFKGIKVKLTRNYDGSVPNKKVSDVKKLYDFTTDDQAVKYQQEVTKALTEGKLFTLEILN